MEVTGPLYRQIYEVLRQRIQDGVYPAESLLPSETMLIREFGVSQITIRRAMSELQMDGYIRKMQGVGAVVLSGKRQDSIFELSSFSEEVRRQGKVPKSIILNLESVEASTDLAERLKIPSGSMVTYLRRLRLVSDQIVGINETYISPRLNLEINRDTFSTDESLYAFYSRNGIYPSTGYETFEVIMPDKSLQTQLAMVHSQPLLLRQRTTFDPTGVPIEHSRNYYIASTYKFSIQLKRNEDKGNTR